MLVVKGRVDHKQEGEPKLIATRTLQLGPDYRVKPDADFFAEVKSLLGEAAVA